MAAAMSGEDPDRDMRARLAEIRRLEKTDGLPAVERALVDLLRQGPQTHQGFLALARVLMRQRRFDDAIRAAQKARSLAPLEGEPVIAVGLGNLLLQDYPAAAAAFADAIRLDPNSPHAHLGAAAVKLAGGNHDEALAICEKAIALGPELDRAHELMARIHVRMGDRDKAIARLQGLIQRSPGNRRALRAYVRLMRSDNREAEAIAFLKAEAEAHPGDRRRADVLAYVGAKIGQIDFATEQYRRSQEAGGPSLAEKVRYAMLLIDAGQTDAARDLIASLAAQPLLRPVVGKLNADIAFRSGNYDSAIDDYRLACSSAQVDMLDPMAEAQAADAAERARLWRNHTQSAILMAIRRRMAAA